MSTTTATPAPAGLAAENAKLRAALKAVEPFVYRLNDYAPDTPEYYAAVEQMKAALAEPAQATAAT